MAELPDLSGLILKGDPRFQQTGLLSLDPGVAVDPKDFPYLKTAYDYYRRGVPSSRGAGDVTPVGPITAYDYPTDYTGPMLSDQGAGTTVLGTGGGGAGIMAAGVAAPMGGAQNPLTQMITTPTGETMTVKQAMTQDPAYRLPGTVAPSTGISYEDDLVNVQPGLPMTDLEPMARAQALTDPRYEAEIAPTTVDGVTMKGRTTEFDTAPRSTVAGPLRYLQPDYELEQMARQDPRVMAQLDEEIAPTTVDGVTMKGRTYEPTPTEYAVTRPSGIDAPMVEGLPTGPRGMADVSGPVQNITLPSGDVFAANDPQLLEKVDPETKANANYVADLWKKAKGSAVDFKNYLTDAGDRFNPMQIVALYNTFAGSGGALSFASGLGLPAMIIGALSKAGTQVTPEQRAANAAFEAEQGITIGADGRIIDPSGVLTGKIPAGKSFAGSATYDEMIDKKIDYFEDRIAKGKSYSEKNYQAALDLRGKEKEAPTGVMKPGGYPTEAIPTEAEEDMTDLMGFETLGPWATDDTPIETPTGIVEPTAPAEVWSPGVGGGGGDVDQPSGGGYSPGGHHWAKGGRVRYKKGGIVDLL